MTIDFIKDYILSLATTANVMGITGAFFHIVSMSMRFVVPLRITGIASASFLLLAAILSGGPQGVIIYGLLIPLHSFRLYQMLKLVKKARVSAQGDLSLDWLKPFMTRRKYRKNDVLFRKGDPAKEMLFIVTGKLLVKEMGVELPAGGIVGELGFLSPSNRRTQSVECVEDGDVMTITYDKLLELYFENPEFGYYFLRLSSERLMQNVARLEAMVEQNQAKPTHVVAALRHEDSQGGEPFRPAGPAGDEARIGPQDRQSVEPHRVASRPSTS
jgi:hypothetical protein